jgi:DNA polymerase (family X)
MAKDPENAAIAERLEAFAALLDLAGASYYTARAYRRAAELIRATPAPVAELVREGRVRDLRGIGPGIERRLVELVETGRIAELDELEREVQPQIVGLGLFLGLSAKRSVEVGKALGVTTPEEFREAARAGRLREVPGIGPKREAAILAALEREERPRPRRGLLLNRARALVEPIAEAVGGVAAGDPRRWRDTSERLAIVTSDNNALDRFQQLPEIVAVVDGTIGVTVEGVQVELVVAPVERFGTELVRATGSEAYVAALEPLPAGSTEAEVYARLGVPWCPPELREEPHRAEPPVLLELAEVRGDLPLPYNLVGREGERPRDGRGGARARLRVPRHLRPHPERRRGSGPDRGHGSPPG